MADTNEDKKDENKVTEPNEKDERQQPFVPQQLGPQDQPAMTDEKMQPVQDGAIPQNSQGITQGQFDALDPIGNAEIKFEQGNYQTILGLPKVVSDKTAQLMQTFVPLIEVSLIELLGSNSMYKRSMGQCQPSFDNQGKISIEFTFQYQVEQWIGQDISLEAIQHDANYILNKLKPVKANISKCEINVTDGSLTIMGTI